MIDKQGGTEGAGTPGVWVDGPDEGLEVGADG